MAISSSPQGRVLGTSTYPFVLMYHSVAEYTEDPHLVTVRPARFQRQLRWMRDRGLTGVRMDRLVDAWREGRARGLVGLTFDDGYTDFAATVLPALRRYGFTATVFVIADRLGGHNAWEAHGPRKSLMDARQLREAATCGMEIGSHGLLHQHLGNAEPPTLVAEVRRSRALVEDEVQSAVTGFCYPYGDISGAAVGMVRDAGYAYGCAIWRSPLSGVHALPRTYVGDRDHPLRLEAKLLRHRMRSAR